MAENEIRSLKDNEYFLFYAMIMNAIRTEDVFSGLNNSLFLLKEFLHSGNVVLHRKEDDSYIHRISDATLNYPSKDISCIVNKTSSLIERKGIYCVEMNLSESFKNMLLMHLNTRNYSYILSINNCLEHRMDSNFWHRLKDTMQEVLNRAESYEKNMKAISTDLLTGLENRNSYEMRLEKINESEAELVYGLFDLFRLKYINDNYSHAIGDVYIREVANILNRYWPKQKTEIIEDTETFVDTGHTVYRVGGDEFVLITTKENLDLARVKAGLASEEAKMIDLGVGGELPIGLNLGIVEHSRGDIIKDTYMKADALMSDDKKKMYLKYGLERRK